MANLTEHVILNKWDNDINDAIVSVGGNTQGSAGLPDYAKIIREQLVARGLTPAPEPGKEFILEGDSCIIEADVNGCDQYNTEYAVGVKSGLIPGVLYMRLCTAVNGIEPVYIDLQRLTGSSTDIDVIINELLNSNNFIESIKGEVIQEVTVLQENIEQIQEQITSIQDTMVDQTVYEQDMQEINNQLIQKVDENVVKIIVNNVIEENTNDEGINVDELRW